MVTFGTIATADHWFVKCFPNQSNFKLIPAGKKVIKKEVNTNKLIFSIKVVYFSLLFSGNCLWKVISSVICGLFICNFPLEIEIY